MSDDDYVDPNDFDEREEESNDFEAQAKLDELYLKAYTGQLNDDPEYERVELTPRTAKDASESELSVDESASSESDDAIQVDEEVDERLKETKKSDKIQFKDGTFFVESSSSEEGSKSSKKRKRGEDDDAENDTAKRARKGDTNATPGRPTLRYWGDNKSQFTVRCYRCGKMGHMSATCAEEAKIEKCPLCGASDHGMNKCPNELCHRCKQPGHQKRDCDNRPFLMPVCYICRRSGHDPASCQELLPVEEKSAYCSNCAMKGHSSRFCQEPKTDDYRLMGQRGSWDQTSERLKGRKRRASANDAGYREVSFSQRFSEGNRRDRDEYSSYRGSSSRGRW